MLNNDVRTEQPIQEAKEGALRVLVIINPPNEANYVYVNSPTEAATVINQEATNQLKDPLIFANVFGLEVFENGEWTEWYNEDGDDIHTVMENEEDEY